jgi:tetratricopeptide (TPR) repeat protein
MKIIYKLTLSLVLVYALAAQPALENQYKMAESFEKSGDMKNAARIYEEILKADPKNYMYFKGLARSMKATNQFSALLPYIEQQLTFNKYPETYIIYGEVLWRSGKVKEAGIAWDQAIEAEPNSETVYDELSNTQINMMLFEKAIATLLKSRVVFDNDLLFTEKLSQLYIATGNFRDGTKEVLGAYESNRNLQAAQGKLTALMFNDEAKKYINSELDSRSSSSRETGYKKIYAWFLSARGEYEKALQKYIEIDEKTNTGGYEVYLYAQSLRIDGIYDIALKAYEFVLGLGKKSTVFQQALFGFARTLEDKFSQDSVFNKTELNKVTDMYEDIISQFPNTQIAWDCSMRKAEIYLNYLGKTEVAAEELLRMISGTRGSNQKAEALNLLGDVYISLDNLSDAYSAFLQVAMNFGKNGIAEVREKALYRLSEIEYFRGNIDSALAGFKSLSVISTSAYSNDAINKMIIIEDNLKFKDALILFASAELKERQKKISEAVELYLGTAQKARGETLAEKSYIKAAELSFSIKNYDKARELALELLKLYQNTIYGDYAMLIIADSYYEQGRGEEALQSYTELLKKFNRSIYLEKARERIRKLRNS